MILVILLLSVDTDPESGELQKLKEDLLQVIDLTKELVQASAESEVPQQTEATSSSTER